MIKLKTVLFIFFIEHIVHIILFVNAIGSWLDNNDLSNHAYSSFLNK